MIETLGEDALTLPAQIEAGLAANDRLKYYFALLQVARSHADQPDRPASSLKQERLVARIDDGALDRVVAAARKKGSCYRMTGCRCLMAALADDARIIAGPAEAAFQSRLAGLVNQLPKASDNLLESYAIDNITQADRDRADGLHRLVMDLHKRLNALQAGLAEEHIDGAAAYHLGAGDAELVRALMTGLQPHRAARVQASEAWHHRDALWTAAHHSKRYRDDRCPRCCHPRRRRRSQRRHQQALRQVSADAVDQARQAPAAANPNPNARRHVPAVVRALTSGAGQRQ